PWSPRAQRSVYSARRKMAPSRRKRSNASSSGSTGGRVRSFIGRRTVVFRSAFPASQSWSGPPSGLRLPPTIMNGNETTVQRRRGKAVSTSISFKQYGGNAAENYERYFVPTIGMPFATALLDAAGLHRGERVLDVACGTGVVARLAAERVAPNGAVAGLDINPAMLAVARSVPSSSAAIEWHEASAESLPLADGSFDVVLSSLGLQFVDDKASGLGEMRRVLAPHGRLAIATVGPTPPLFAILEQALARHVKPEVAAFMRAVFSLHEPQDLEKLTTGAGFRDVEVRSKALSLTRPGPGELLWQS